MDATVQALTPIEPVASDASNTVATTELAVPAAAEFSLSTNEQRVDVAATSEPTNPTGNAAI